MTFPHAVLGFTAVAFIGFGLAFTIWPVPMAALVEISLPTATARVDLAATYGGFEVGFGVFLLLALRRPTWVEAGLWAGLSALAGFAVVRLLTVMLTGSTVRAPIYVGLGLELGGVLLNLWGIRELRRHPHHAV